MARLHWSGDEAVRGTRKGRWTRAEVDRLKDMYGLRPEASIARDLGRSVASVRKMADELFRTASRRQGPWTAGEIQELKRYLGVSGPEVIARILGRDPEEVKQQVFELGRIQHNSRWNREEVHELRRLFGTRTDADLAVIFGRSIDAVQRVAKKYCLAKDKAFLKRQSGKGATRMPRWAEAELTILREVYPRMPNLEIAQRLNRSVKSIVSKAHYIGIKKEIDRLREMGRENVGRRYR
ncbi:MAG: hypothetical protein FJ294_15140 [Planctomycetes bacterium]|nr:hypothetical protein [Planctomycetota bacterium]